MKKKLISYVLTIIGLFIVFGTHFFLVASYINNSTTNLGLSHAVINIIGGILVTIGYLMK